MAQHAHRLRVFRFCVMRYKQLGISHAMPLLYSAKALIAVRLKPRGPASRRAISRNCLIIGISSSKKVTESILALFIKLIINSFFSFFPSAVNNSQKQVALPVSLSGSSEPTEYQGAEASLHLLTLGIRSAYHDRVLVTLIQDRTVFTADRFQSLS